ncbi:hypothetical protein ACFOY2_45800 [Nonomuraea purpurea]|uniref:Uncharacterized protein n=1 Tax=Nonomuraea purpurea TaxID=1849276 RepID=A0ABV8GP29_9ACTN
MKGAEDTQRSGRQLSQTGWRLIRIALLLVSTAGVIWIGQRVLWLSLLLGFVLLLVAGLVGSAVRLGPDEPSDRESHDSASSGGRPNGWDDHIGRPNGGRPNGGRPKQHVGRVTDLIPPSRIWLMVLLSAGALTWVIHSFSGRSTPSPPTPPVVVTVTVTAAAPTASPQPAAAEQASTAKPTDWIAALAGALGAVGGVAGGIGAILAARGSMMSAKAALLTAEAQQRQPPKP